MRILVIISILALLPSVFLGQDKEMKRLFNQYEDVTGFSLKSEDPDIDLDLDGNFSDFLNNVDNIYVLKFDKDKGRLSDRDAFESKLVKLCNKKDFSTMLNIEGEGSVKMMSRKNNKEETTDFLMITHGDDESMIFWATAD
jgi:hypothetical protein